MSPPADPRAVLLARATDALCELREVGCHDPAAAHAMRVIGLTGYTVEHFWIPALERQLGRVAPPERHEHGDV